MGQTGSGEDGSTLLLTPVSSHSLAVSHTHTTRFMGPRRDEATGAHADLAEVMSIAQGLAASGPLDCGCSDAAGVATAAK